MVLFALNLFMLFRILVAKRGETGRERRYSLLAGFILGATPLALTALGFATSFAAFRVILNREDPVVDLEWEGLADPGKPVFFIGLDTSGSALRRDGRTARDICSLVDRMFFGDESLARQPAPIPIEAPAQVWGFAGTSETIERTTGEIGDPQIADLVVSVCERLVEISKTQGAQTLQTDVLDFLERILDQEVKPALASGHRVTIVIISDFLQDSGEEEAEEEKRVRDIADRLWDASLRAAHRTVVADPRGVISPAPRPPTFDNLALFGLAIKAPVRGVRSSPLDLLPLLRGELQGLWKDAPAVNVLDSYPPHDRMQLAGSMAALMRVNVENTLYLKYEPSESDTTYRSYIRNAVPSFETSSGSRLLALQLRRQPGGSLPSELRVRYWLDDSRERTLSSIEGEGGWAREHCKAGAECKLALSLESHLDVSRSARLELLLAVPEARIVYAVPVVILPTPNRSALGAFYLVVRFFVLCVVAFYLAEVWTMSLPHYSKLRAVAPRIGSRLAYASKWLTRRVRRRVGNVGVRLVLAILASSTLIGCNRPMSSPEIRSLLECVKQPLAAGRKPAVDRRPLQIYLDASMSMRGFISVPQGRFRRTVDRLLDRSIAGGYDVSVFKFDDKVSRMAATTSTAALVEKGFFNGGETSFPALFDFIRSERKPGSIAIVVTDLVQSGRTGEQRELARAFRDLAEDRPEALLIALRSPFVGRYWPESTPPGDAFPLDLRGQDRDSSRPFYLLILADRAEELVVLRRHLELISDPASPSSWEIDASRPAITVMKADFAPPASGPEARAWQAQRHAEDLPPLGRTHRRTFWLVEGRAPPADGAPLRLRLQLDGRPGVKQLSQLAVEAERCRCIASSRCAEPEYVTITARVEQPSDHELLVSYGFPRPARGTWEGYRVRLLPGSANLIRPINVGLWTTDDDSVQGNGTRTFKLDLFVDTLTNALREPVAVSEQFIFLGRGD